MPRKDYELRGWFDNDACLYTNDARVKDMAVRSPALQIAATYFRATDQLNPVGWDIVGAPSELSQIAARFGERRPGAR